MLKREDLPDSAVSLVFTLVLWHDVDTGEPEAGLGIAVEAETDSHLLGPACLCSNHIDPPHLVSLPG